MSRNVLVTGASRGLGLGIAKALATDGFRVHAVARRCSDDLATLLSGKARAGSIRFEPFDLQEVEAIPDLIRDLCAEHGPLYGLVNNAGIGTEGVLATMPLASIERLLRLNTLAPIVVAKHAVRSMMSAGSGRIVNIASVVAFTGANGLSVYAATKASMVGFTRSLAREVGPLGITVNAVAPGFVATDMTASLDAAGLAQVARRSALRRLPEVADIANAVSYLVSDKASNVTGTIMTVDGGMTA